MAEQHWLAVIDSLNLPPYEKEQVLRLIIREGEKAYEAGFRAGLQAQLDGSK